MITLTPFDYIPRYEGAEHYVVYSVNCTNPDKLTGWFQGYFYCTSCGTGNQFRFYDESPHQCKCPKCNSEFLVVDDTDNDED